MPANVKNGALLDLVDRMELDKTTTESLEHEMSQEESEMFSVLSLWTKRGAIQLVKNCEDKNGHAAWKKPRSWS